MTATATAPGPAARPGFWQSLAKKPMLVTLLFGFSSGLPLLLTLRTLQAWMTEAGVDLKSVGLLSLVGLPYSLKFLWAPVFDRFSIAGLGRRKGWLALTQILLMIGLAGMGFLDPKTQTGLISIAALFVAFFSASQDTLIDAYRRESLAEEDLAMGSTFYLYGYRAAMWVSGGFALWLADQVPWSIVYLCMAGAVGVGLFTTWWCAETKAPEMQLKSWQAWIVPLKEFFSRNGSILILLFILMYKVGDVMAGNMLTPFYLKMGFSKTEIAAIAKTLSLPVSLFGGFLGGAFVHRFGILRGLWIFGIAQMLTTLLLSILLFTDHSLIALGTVILSEDLATSMATAAFLAFNASMTNVRFTATQYALLSSLMVVPRVILASPAGYLVDAVGWFGFFMVCSVIAIPGLFLLVVLKRRQIIS